MRKRHISEEEDCPYVLDTTDLSLHADWPEGAPQLAEARAYLEAHPLSESDPHMVWGGASLTPA